MSEPKRPIPESYWVEPDRFLAGEYPGHFDGGTSRKRINALLEAGFNTFIDLTRPDETVPYAGMLAEEAKLLDIDVERHNFPIGDFGLPTPAGMTAILDAVDAALQKGRKVYLHCWGGIGRTGTTVGCYLVRHGRSGEEALRQLAEWWRSVPKSRIHQRSPETGEQARFVLQWARHDDRRGEQSE
jgi:hypothetical protein